MTSTPAAPEPNDRPLIHEIFAPIIAAYTRLRTYSGRFSSNEPTWGYHQSGTIQFQRPNFLAMQMRISFRGAPYTRRMVCDGRFLWTLDSRFEGVYTRGRVFGPGCALLLAGGTIMSAGVMDLGWMLLGEMPCDLVLNDPVLRLVSAPDAPTLIVDRLTPPDPDNAPEVNAELAHTKMTFRFGPDRLLRASSSQGHFGVEDKFEEHSEIQIDASLPAALFRFKPAPGAKRIPRFDTVG